MVFNFDFSTFIGNLPSSAMAVLPTCVRVSFLANAFPLNAFRVATSVMQLPGVHKEREKNMSLWGKTWHGGPQDRCVGNTCWLYAVDGWREFPACAWRSLTRFCTNLASFYAQFYLQNTPFKGHVWLHMWNHCCGGCQCSCAAAIQTKTDFLEPA